jgi:hypothetical protein
MPQLLTLRMMLVLYAASTVDRKTTVKNRK